MSPGRRRQLAAWLGKDCPLRPEAGLLAETREPP
jgi:hypothetical protein